MDLTTLVPTTALVAVIIFIVKECGEAARRWESEKRRKSAYYDLLARECELNNWAMRSLRGIAADLNSERSGGSGGTLSIEYAISGRIYAKVQRPDGSYSKSTVPNVHIEVMSRHLVDIATLDKRLFQFVEAALTACAELQHVREGLLFHGSTEDEEERGFSQGFYEYAIEEIEVSYEAISALYVACTGKPLKVFRQR